MPWRGQRKSDKPEQRLGAATIARGPDAASTESAVRSVLARTELERPLAALVIVDLDDEPVASDLGGILDVRVVRIDAVADADSVIVVASSATPAADVVAALEPIQSVLIGVVLVDPDSAPASGGPAQAEAADRNDALAALVELERAAGSQAPAVELSRPAVVPEPEPGPEPEPEPEPGPEAGRGDPADEELARRLSQLTHREAALRRMIESIEKQRTRLEEREQALERESSDARDGEDTLAEAIRRATEAEERVRVLEAQLAALEARLAEAEARTQIAASIAPTDEPVVPPPVEPATPEPSGDGRYTLQQLEKLVAEAELRGDAQAEEWAYYLPLLREHANFDGRIPMQFDSLIDSVFGEALG